MDTEHNKLLDLAFKLALDHPDSGVLEELAFLSDVQLQAEIDRLQRLSSP